MNNGIPILNGRRLAPHEVLAQLQQDRQRDDVLIHTMTKAFLDDVIAALKTLPPPSDTMRMAVGPGTYVNARVAANWTTMQIVGEGGKRWVGLALATGPTDAIIAKMEPAQTDKLIADLTNKRSKIPAPDEKGS